MATSLRRHELLFATVLMVFVFLNISLAIPTTSALSLSSNYLIKMNAQSAGFMVLPRGFPIAPNNMKVQSEWTVPATGPCESVQSLSYEVVIVTGNVGEFAGTVFFMNCNSVGSKPQDLVEYWVGNFLYPVSPSDTVSLNDQMRTIVSYTNSTGAIMIIIKDITKGWIFRSTGFTAPSSPNQEVLLQFGVGGGSNSLPFTFNNFKTTKDLI